MPTRSRRRSNRGKVVEATGTPQEVAAAVLSPSRPAGNGEDQR
jgi:hypothetical protein